MGIMINLSKISKSKNFGNLKDFPLPTKARLPHFFRDFVWRQVVDFNILVNFHSFWGSFWSHEQCFSLMKTHILRSSNPPLDVPFCNCFLQPPPFVKGWSSIPLSGSMQPGRPGNHRYTSGTSGGTGSAHKKGRRPVSGNTKSGQLKDGHWDGKIGEANSIFGHVEISL